MKEKKHIDRLFQEGFKDFEVSPSDAVWQNIEAKLNKNKKKRRVIPIWWRYAGVAALLLLFFTIDREYFKNTNVTPSIQVVDTKDEPSTKSLSPNNTIDFNENRDSIKNTTIASEGDKNKINNQPVNNDQNIITSNNSSKNQNQKNKTNSIINNNKASTNQIIAHENNKVTNNSNGKELIKNKDNEAISETDKTAELKNSVKNNTSVIAENSNQDDDNALTNKISEKNKPSIEEAIAEANKDENEKKSNKWSIATNAAPVYFNSLGKGSSIDAQFNDNAKNGEVTMSYGIGASYAINNKLSIRSGINKVNLGYNTNNVVVFESVGLTPSVSALKNINTGDNPDNISLISGESLSNANNEAFIKTSNTSINQSLGYIEIPLEIEYAIINKKFGFNVIGGFSSFILSNNELFSEFEGRRTKIGEASNLNKVSYSANFGLGINYKITKKIDLNLEPLFKYQINTFNNTSGNFKPYFIGVYTGIGFKF
ncbi:hypothetical protein V8G69_02010 [Gaetbulibacter sp. M235]|uniref:hypothetical protein n=1 Tax=Gaetbulibacter sp. M235 TaxID=3126510 RepID=UPI00374EFDD1